VVTCFEDNDAHVAYGPGWHLVSAASASAGHFRMTANKSSATLAFTVADGKFGAVTYKYATSPKGGSAQVYLDGALQGTVSFRGTAGSTKNPVFGGSVRYEGLHAGNHTLEIRPVSGVAYVDGFCLESSYSGARPASGPGTTTASSGSLAPGQQSLLPLSLPAGTQAISVIAEPSIGVPIQVVLVDPRGAILKTADASSGLAVIDASAGPGTYLVKVLNAGVGPVEVWTAATPLVSR
jgi:hypothetical protein